ncbi:hypothetical protein [Lactobacillus helveticus]|nr:hypothetical protein [Lactobacillus helveticus]
MLGTWYSYDNHEKATVTFTDHTIEETENGHTVTTELHKMKPDRDRGEDKAYWAKTKHWATISKFKMPESKPKDNKLYYNIYGWNETAGDGEFYAVHTEEVACINISWRCRCMDRCGILEDTRVSSKICRKEVS